MSEHQTLRTTCCVVGGGPAGMMLSLLLARAGVDVTLLEAHRDFDRDFRGDMIHPSTLEVLDQIGLAEPLHALPHTKLRELRFVHDGTIHRMAVFARLPTRFGYVMVMPQARFLDFLATEARRYPNHRVVMGASVQALREQGGAVRGVGCDGPDFHGDVAALLTVGADGRFSRVRRLGGFAARPQSHPMEVIWFRLPRDAGDPAEETFLHFAPGRVVVLLGREDDWQVGCVVPPGRFHEMKTAGIESLRGAVACVPWLGGRLEHLADWREVNVLKIVADRVTRWHRPGLMVIGDAAHAMLPVGGVGINCAIADAVEAANVLAGPLAQGAASDELLHEVQRRRERLTAAVQRFQRVQHRVLRRTLEARNVAPIPLALRLALRLPGLRDLPARVMAFGIRRAVLEDGNRPGTAGGAARP